MRKMRSYIAEKIRIAAVVAGILLGMPLNTFAAEKNITVEGNVFTSSEKNNGFPAENQEKISDKNTFGEFSIVGDLKENGKENGVIAFDAVGDTIDSETGEDESEIKFVYTYDDSLLNADESNSWKLVEDGSKKINGIDIGEKAGAGTIIVQSSFDNENWMINEIKTDVFETDKTNDGKEFYETVLNQLVNGCYYRVTVAYQTRKLTGKTKVGPVKLKDNYEYCERVEVYEFYIINKAENAKAAKSTDMPCYQFDSDPVNAGVDTEYSKKDGIDSDDISRGCQIGQFFINGFSGNPHYYENDKKEKTNPVFLKNVGDKVTLWFDLKQKDITALNGNESLSIYSDEKGGDKDLHVSEQNFKRGALTIRFTDYQNKKKTNTYTDYLAAAATTTADTKVQLFEEGDYEIALDYVIEDNSSLFWKVPKPAKRYAYRISFKFSIRNSNCMVYPMNLKGGELRTFYTEDGFKLDLARSRYLDLSTKRKVLSEGGLDLRESQIASDLDEFTDEGIYEFTVKNTITGDENTKAIYVGTDNLMKSYVKYGKDYGGKYSVSDLREMKENGYVFLDDGTIEAPEPEIQEELDALEESVNADAVESGNGSQISVETAVEEPAVESVLKNENTVEQDTEAAETAPSEIVVSKAESEQSGWNMATPIIIIAAVAVVGVVIWKKKTKK